MHTHTFNLHGIYGSIHCGDNIEIWFNVVATPAPNLLKSLVFVVVQLVFQGTTALMVAPLVLLSSEHSSVNTSNYSRDTHVVQTRQIIGRNISFKYFYGNNKQVNYRSM